MRYLTFSPQESSSYDTCFLVPFLHRADIERYYIEPHLKGQESTVLAYDLHKKNKRTPIKEQREYLQDLLPVLRDLSITYLVVCDAEYFKTLTKAASADGNLGYVCPVEFDGHTFQVVYCPSFRAIFYDPEKVTNQISISLGAILRHQKDSYVDPGMDIIKFAAYPKSVESIRTWLKCLLDEHTDLTADIETFSLKHYDAGIGTISFAWSKTEGIAFPVDLLDLEPEDIGIVRRILIEFFQEFARRSLQDGRKMRWHNITFDVYILVYELFMEHILDTEGLLQGMDTLLASWDCTKLVTYLATNSCSGNDLGLKFQAQEYAGNYAVEDIKDIRKIPLDDLLQYNLIDTLATWFVFEKHWDTLVADQQLPVYETIFKPAVLDVIQMQLTGLPIDMDAVKALEAELDHDISVTRARMDSNPLIEAFVSQLNEEWVEWKNSTLKIKRVSLADAKEAFNPNSGPQLQRLLYEKNQMDLPVLDLTDSKLPATGKDTLEKLKSHTQDPQILDFLDALIEFKNIDKLVTAFIPAFLKAHPGPDGWHYLFGNFNLGGTVSGRLSSSKPNLQNLPASTALAIKVKRCFKAPPGWLFVGLDFSSLEDRISALTTKDPQKLKVYTDGYDGHCLRAYSYFGDQMPDIDPSSVQSINSIEKKYKPLRQLSKAPTFALTYQGTYHTLMNNCGFSQIVAQKIEAAYHDLYKVSDDWVADKLDEASRLGYVTVAFGLRVRTPLLHQVIRGNSKTPYEAEAEGRTAGNALGQSWGLLNNRAASEFMGKVRVHPSFRLNIRPCAHIHDAQYYLIRHDMEILLWMNEHLVEAVSWQDHPDIWHSDVKLGGELSVFHPDWSWETVIPNGADAAEIIAVANDSRDRYLQKIAA